MDKVILCASALIAVIIFNACSSSEQANNLNAISEPTLAAFQFGKPIITKLQAVIAARRGINGSRLHFVGEPTVARVEQMTRTQAEQIARTRTWNEMVSGLSTDQLVWFVIFNAAYQIFPPGPDATPLPIKHGCVFAIVNAEDGDAFHVGGEITCPDRK